MAEGISHMIKNMQEEIKTRVARIWLDEDGIIRVVYSPGTEVTLEDAEEIFAIIKRISDGKIRPCFVNPAKQKSISREARMYMTINAPEILTACAVLITSPLTQIIANFIIGLNKLINKEAIPLKIFTSEKKAFDWLREYIV
jgi:hypothetical protein